MGWNFQRKGGVTGALILRLVVFRPGEWIPPEEFIRLSLGFVGIIENTRTDDHGFLNRV
ncbi:hypothetical protein SLEP1_g26733 [Rubroshorea leprosula]|uniref:Uncharacterized protein n=1 Tax=Rubroshorea leprosula TaxID=152421 RepID=A0AAV5JZ90_9ROSI|nr:hypothetical protein SLEP1_g26733 [Rubroshorea leprosula]